MGPVKRLLSFEFVVRKNKIQNKYKIFRATEIIDTK